MTRPCLTERFLMGRKESNQTNKIKLTVMGALDDRQLSLNWFTIIIPYEKMNSFTVVV